MKLIKQIALFCSLLLVPLWGNAQCDNLNANVIDVGCDGQEGFFAVVEIFAIDSIGGDCNGGWIDAAGQINTFGVYTFGPFQLGDVITLSIVCADDPNCVTDIVLTSPNDCLGQCGLFYQGVIDTTWADCGESNGDITFQISGTGDYSIETYSADGSLLSTTDNSNVVTGLAGGQYSFLFRCENGSVFGQDFYVIPTDAGFEAAIDVQTVDCANYTLTAEPSGPEYSYIWSNGVTTQTNIVPGGNVYFVTVTNGTDCPSITNTAFLQANGPTINAFIDNENCEGGNGAIYTSVFGGVSPYAYNWWNGETTSFVTGLTAGAYVVTVTDANGCEVIEEFVVESVGLEFEYSGAEYLCGGTATAIVYPLDSFELFTYLWTNESGTVVGTEMMVEVDAVGTYTVVVTDENGCTGTVDIVVEEGVPSDLDAEIQFQSFPDSIDGGCAQFISFVGNGGPGQGFYAAWQVPGEEFLRYGYTISVNEFGAGMYIGQTYSQGQFCPLIDTIIIQPEDIVCVNVSGHVYLNLNTDCDLQDDDISLENQLLNITNLSTTEVYYAYTDFQGDYSISLPPGSYSVDLGGGNDLLETCTPVGFTLVDGVPLTNENVPVIGSEACPRVTVNLTVPLLRRCFYNGVYLNYENTGTVIAEDVVLTVEFGEFADEVLDWFGPAADQIDIDPVTGLITATFNIGDLAPFQGGTRYLQVYSCNDDFPLDAAGCITATATPNNPCPPADPDWSGASLRVAGDCNDDEVSFTVTNVGDATMTVPLSYIVIEDGVLLSPEPIMDDSLTAGEEKLYTFPANGATYHFQVDQEPLHPGLAMPIDFVEGCANGQNVSYGFALQFPVSDDAYWIDEECNELIGSYDPNDKRAMPRGYSDNQYIEAGQMLDYTIRFQNTGTDTAFTVVVRDTLSSVFDMSTLEITGSTHSFSPRIDSSGQSLAFFFENILLVDSFTNEPGSHGAISFRIMASEDLAPGTLVDNNAAIYFDFNAPVITNTYRLVVEEDFVTVGVFNFQPEVADLRVFPNPTAGIATIQLPAAITGQTLQLEVYDLLGRRQVNYNYSSGDTPQVDLSTLPAGWYNLRLSTNNGEVLGNGRVLLQR